ncbi:glycosyltransferase family 4 protein [Bradyrhizobium sp.]|uniref:glycosyltransferase family 4 protein n=1 Tax=Bradyrhizobium sp. TaxID=376 RepID=UPI003C7286D5
MPIVLAPRGDDNRYSQDSFVFDLFAKYGYSVLKKGRCGYEPVRTPDFIVSHNPDDPDDSLFLKRFSSTPSVVHLHYQLEYYRDHDNLALALGCASAAIAPTAFLADKMSRKFPGLEWNVVSNGVRKHLFFASNASERAKFRRQRGIRSNGKLIGFVGRLTKAKGLDILERICRQITHIDATLLIQFPYWHNSADPSERDRSLSLAQSLQQLAPKHIVLYPDRAPRFPERPIRYLDALLMPSLSELQPMVVLEALASGVPVIGTRSTPFYEELVETLIERQACNLVDLPSRFSSGGTSEDHLYDDELKGLSDALLRLIYRAPIPSDNERLSLESGMPRDYVDATMYRAWTEIYERHARNSRSQVTSALN